MAAVNPEVLQKFKNARKLPTRQEGDGHEIQVEVREDEEQTIKLQEIIDLLVAAGYFRARIKGLSPFDKVVGGMTWCIESCSVDLDVDLLFQENSTIGQKIALTEKIVAVLPKMKCPHRIEPHQIQGLDFIHIFPVIQWLVKTSMEFREEQSVFVRSYAVNQFNKEFTVEQKNAEQQRKLLQNISAVNEVYRPNRYYKRKNAKNTPTPDIDSRVQLTLLEYGHRGAGASTSKQETEAEKERLEEKHIQQLLKSLTTANQGTEVNYGDLNAEDKEMLAKHYAMLQSEFKDGGVKSKEESHILSIKEQKQAISEQISKLDNANLATEKDIKECTETLEEIRLKQQEANKALKDLEDSEAKDPKSVKEVEDLVILNDNLRSQELQFREHCKQELVKLQNLIEETKKAKSPTTSNAEISEAFNEQTELVRIARLQLAKKNRIVAALQRQLDEVPDRAELAQYQRRFLELYNQVAAKHKETKQYFTLYNTLEDTRIYMKKELSLLNSISDNYPEAMQSKRGKEEFLEQFQNIVDGVRQSKLKVQQKVMEERTKRDNISNKLQGLVDQQRKYVNAVRQLSIECKRLEALYAKNQNQE